MQAVRVLDSAAASSRERVRVMAGSFREEYFCLASTDGRWQTVTAMNRHALQGLAWLSRPEHRWY
jgi:hypothetical protein